MSTFEAESVCTYLRSKEIQMTPNNIWLTNCMDWYQSHPELVQIYGTVQEYVCIQFLLTDQQDVRQSCLPANCNTGTSHFNGKYTVQINWVRDIGQSCYSQLRAVRNVNEAESNENVSVDEPKKQSWEPNPKRVLMMEVTDGITILKAMEYSPIPKLIEPVLPGLKVLLIGPIECRKGILLLKNENINILGGEVDHLYEMNSKENLLSRCLNITNSNTTQEGQRSRYINGSGSGFNQSCRPQHAVNMEEEHLVTMVENNEENSKMLMTDEDDDILCQLPDEVLGSSDKNGPSDNTLNYADNSFSNCQGFPPVLNNRSCRDNQLDNLGAENTKVLCDQSSSDLITNSSNLKKPRLFPSLEDLRPVESNTTVQNTLKNIPLLLQTNNEQKVNQTLSETSCNILTSTNRLSSPMSYQATTSDLGNVSFNKPLVNLSNFCNSAEKVVSNVENREGANESLQMKSSNTQEREDGGGNVCPKLKTMKVKVVSITKLKIRNSEWLCSANVIVENKPSNITFSDEVLETLFGVSASEAEVWRDEMANNPSLKNKVNDILKAGQTKLKLLDCLMVLEYSSENCIPHVVAVISPKR